jgi:2-hydroxychromene-2-carboxylate isomerase
LARSAATTHGVSFYYDLASPYAYLASARVDEMLGPEVHWKPILVGAVHKHYRRVSWGATPDLRAAGIAEIEQRAADYELPPIVWPEPYPANSLIAMRAAVWANQRERGRAFAEIAFAMAFREGIDLTQPTAVALAAERAALDPEELARALVDPQLKSDLRKLTENAIASGVYGVPTFDAGGFLWWGDHLLPAARAAEEWRCKQAGGVPSNELTPFMPVSLLNFLRSPEGVDLPSALAEDIRFHSPAADYAGRSDVAHLVTAISTVLEDMSTNRTLSQGATTTAFFTARVEGHVLDGVLDERFDADGRIAEASLFLRPYAGLGVAIDRMRAKLAQDPLPRMDD